MISLEPISISAGHHAQFLGRHLAHIKSDMPPFHHDDSVVATHTTVLCDEAVAALSINDDGVYVDATFGRGGHSREILRRLGKLGRLVAFDRDAEAIATGWAIGDPRLTLVHQVFSALSTTLATLGITQIDGLLLDLGVSSPQLDNAQRGFSFRFNAPLDMRMDQTQGETAAAFLARVSERELANVLHHYGEERYSKRIAKAIISARQNGQPLDHTIQLAELVSAVLPVPRTGLHPATRTFQALRIFINQELTELQNVLMQALRLLKPGGRIVVLSFHSLEDRIVKRFFRRCAHPEHTLPSKLALRATELPKPMLKVIDGATRASVEAIQANIRARSVVLRVAERV